VVAAATLVVRKAGASAHVRSHARSKRSINEKDHKEVQSIVHSSTRSAQCCKKKPENVLLVDSI
jgi:hypothetical protein